MYDLCTTCVRPDLFTAKRTKGSFSPACGFALVNLREGTFLIGGGGGVGRGILEIF